ncbi:hypothetical protein ABGB12_23970 [Actinocorallia sp. B10E7]|uniref:hypothetical protein n=1 Tax=Actinocorallia sp. B10E7 TaxID=3153558 RepID=UPI00325F2DC2
MRADFDRVYSPPEPPEPSRWRPRGWQVALVSFLLAAGAVFFAVPLFFDGSPREGAMPTLTSEREDPASGPAEPDPGPSEGSTAEPSETAAPEPSASSPTADSGGGLLTELPKKVCESVPKAVFLKWVPGGEAEEYGGSRAGSCGYSGGGGDDFRYLRLETRLGETTGDMDPISIAKWSFNKDYEQQKEDKITKTLLLERVPGLGEEAFRRVYSDVGEPRMTTARVEVRVRNVIITVSYSRTYDEKPQEEQSACLEGARKVAEEALRSYS